jgi:hypothetical protein
VPRLEQPRALGSTLPSTSAQAIPAAATPAGKQREQRIALAAEDPDRRADAEEHQREGVDGGV